MTIIIAVKGALMYFTLIGVVFLALALPTFFITKKLAQFRARKNSAPLLYDYTSHQVGATLSLLSGIIIGVLFFISLLFHTLQTQYPCELEEIYKLFPTGAEVWHHYISWTGPLFLLIPLIIAARMFFIHYRQETIEGNKPNKAFRLIGLAAILLLTGFTLRIYLRAKQSGGGCNGL